MSKEILLKILYEIKNEREPASGFIFLIKNNNFSYNMIVMLGDMLGNAIKSVKSESLKDKFRQAQLQIKKIQIEEQKSIEKENFELKEMENVLSTIEE